MVFPVLAGEAVEEKIKVTVIRNVVIPNNVDDAPTTKVNIVIKNGILDIITEDAISLEDADTTYDASGGIIIGQLDLGQPAGFIILREDPRENIQALLDTKTYASFAIYSGEIL
ncbi:MAG: hypothetical protein ABGY96_06305 [bacterium]|nr:hypothetical protein [Gammaproteobacteria bacterium]HIL97291.1 hypothetical protein [Pseudomonadales bacterium]